VIDIKFLDSAPQVARYWASFCIAHYRITMPPEGISPVTEEGSGAAPVLGFVFAIAALAFMLWV